MKKLLFLSLFVLYLLHNDLWLWNDGRLYAGIPAGLLYHIGYCIAASVMMFCLVRFAWPDYLEVEPKDEDPR